jgi:hypothetical protein
MDRTAEAYPNLNKLPLLLRSSSVVANISGAILDPKGWHGPGWQEPAFTSPHPIGVARCDRI